MAAGSQPTEAPSIGWDTHEVRRLVPCVDSPGSRERHFLTLSVLVLLHDVVLVL